LDGTEVKKLAALEDKHWWYRERRVLLARELEALASRGLKCGRAIDIGAAGGGNTRVLRDRGWDATALEYGPEGAEVAHLRGIPVVRGDATALPFDDQSQGLVVAFDILEHIVDDKGASAEMLRVLRPGGHALVAVPCDMDLWSDHDVAVGHVRRYQRQEFVDLLESSGFVLENLFSWNVLLRPIAARRRRRSTGSDLADTSSLVNAGLRAVITAERYLPLGNLPGISLMARARRVGADG
jgi:SAM-dependent methyltransferase